MTRQLCLAVGLALAGSLLFSTPVLAQRHAAAFPRDGAQLVLENEYVAIWDVTWQEGEYTGMRRRPYDQISVTLSQGAVKVTRPDDTWTIEHSRFGAVHFDSAGTVTGEEGVSDTARRAMVFQIKSYDVPVEPDVARFVQQKMAEGLPGQLDPRNGGTKLFENDQIAVWDKTYAPRGPVHVHYNQVAGVWIQPGVLHQIPVERAQPPCRFEAAARTPEGWPRSPDSPTECQSTEDALARFRAGQLTKVGEVRWHGPGTHHQEQGVGFPSYSPPGPRAIWIGFKHAPAPSTVSSGR